MARQNVGKPKFFIDLIQYWDAKGIVAGIGPYATYGYYAVGNTGGQADETGDSPNGYYPDWLEDVAPPGSSFGNNKGYQPELIGFTPHTYMNRPLYPTAGTDTSSAYFPFSILLKERCQLPETEKYFTSLLNHNFNKSEISKTAVTFAKSFAPWQDRYSELPEEGSYWSSSYNYLDNSSGSPQRGIVNTYELVNSTTLNGFSIQEYGGSLFTENVNRRTPEPVNSQWAYGDWVGDALPSGYTWDDAGLGFDLMFFSLTSRMNREEYYSMPNQGRTDFILGTFNFGPIFEMDRSPDLKLTMTREYDGIKSQETKSGHTLIDIKHDGPPSWRSNMPAWGLHKNNNKSDWRWLYKNAPSRGRRTWDLEFSYLDDTDMMARNESLTNYSPTDAGDFLDGKITGYTAADFETVNDGDGDEQHFISNSQTGSDFFSVVIEKTMGGSLPFMFQPDGNNDSPDQFAICVMERNSFKIKQVAHNVYSIKLKIREIW